MFLVTRLMIVLLCLGLLWGCTGPAQSDTSTASSLPQTTVEPGHTSEPEVLPEKVATQVKATLSEELGVTTLQIEDYSRETWSDGCLGLGGPAESCLAALTEGWQVEVIDPATDRRYIYRTNLNGDHIRRSTRDEA